MAEQHMHTCLCNGEARVDVPSVKAFLSEHLGPYTTARTIDTQRIVQYQSHLARLAKAAAHLAHEPAVPALPPHKPGAFGALTRPETLGEVVGPMLGRTMQQFAEEHPDLRERERRVTILLSMARHNATHDGYLSDQVPPAEGEGAEGAGRAYRVYCYVEALPPPPPAPVPLQLRRRPKARIDAVFKDTTWVNERKQLEAEKGDAHEVVMVDEAGHCMEGTQTNFYAIVDNKVVTAFRDDVLGGTIREILARVCGENGIELVRGLGPSLANVREWEAAFVTSTSRLVLAASEIRVHAECSAAAEGEQGHLYRMQTDHPLLARLTTLVCEDLRRDSELMPGPS